MSVKRSLLSGFAWAEITLVAATGRVLVVPLYWATRDKDPNRTRVGRRVRDMAVIATRLHPMWHFTIRCDMTEPPEGGAVFVSNHCSQADIFLLSHLPWEMKWMAKEELFKSPFLGAMMRMAGDIRIRRGTKDSAREALAACAEYLRRGMSVMIFPEGTRSRDGNLRPFKDGAFRVAIETQKPIVPIAVAGTAQALPKHEWRFGDTHAIAQVGEPIDTRGMTEADVASLKEMTVARIQAMLDVLQPELAERAAEDSAG